MSVFARQEKITVRIGFQSDPIDRTKTCLISKRRSNTVMRRRFLSNRIVDNWNSLPEHVVDATSVNNFKDRYDKFMESNREEQQVPLVH